MQAMHRLQIGSIAEIKNLSGHCKQLHLSLSDFLDAAEQSVLLANLETRLTEPPPALLFVFFL
jgi:hypothetical protein